MQLTQINKPDNSWQNSTSDIAFLLMIFFILTTMWGTPHILQSTGGLGQESVDPSDIVYINYDGTNISYNGQTVSMAELEQKLDKKKKYKINVEDNVEYGKMIDLLSSFAGLGITTVEIVTDGIK